MEQIVNGLTNQLNGQAVYGWDGTKEMQKQFKQDQIPVLVCTHGFGMGIDKPNVRFVVHAMLPRSLEDYYQQAGRAGRDQQSAKCTILFVDEDEKTTNKLLSVLPEDIGSLINNIPDHARSDLVRNLWFITNSFIGRATEKQVFDHVVSQLNFSDQIAFRQITPNFPDGLLPKNSKPKLNVEKALYRLSLLGVVKDYTIQGPIQNPIFQIEIDTNATNISVYNKLNEYIQKYLLESDVPNFLPNPLADNFPSSLIQCGEKLIDFVYEFIEKRRRTALGTMLQVARIGAEQGPEEFRRQLLAFLEESEFTEPVRILASRLDAAEWFSLLDKVKGMDDITKLLGACRRQLQETPEHPGLFLLAGLCSLSSPYPDEGRRLIALSLSGLRGRIDNVDRVEIAKKLQITGKKLFSSSPQKQSTILSAMLIGDTSSDMLDFCYREAEPFSEAHHTAIRLVATRILKTTTKAF